MKINLVAMILGLTFLQSALAGAEGVASDESCAMGYEISAFATCEGNKLAQSDTPKDQPTSAQVSMPSTRLKSEASKGNPVSGYAFVRSNGNGLGSTP